MKPILLTIITLTLSLSVSAQNNISPTPGYDTQVGNMVAMLEDLKSRITNQVRHLDQESTDFLLDDQSNRIGAMILHLAATEKIYQVMTFENRRYNKEESAFWDLPMNLGGPARRKLVGKPISYYLNEWDKVRSETLRVLKTKDDEWLNSNVPYQGMNNHWAWFHVMEHQANHMGQIALIRKRID